MTRNPLYHWCVSWNVSLDIDRFDWPNIYLKSDRFTWLLKATLAPSRLAERLNFHYTSTKLPQSFSSGGYVIQLFDSCGLILIQLRNMSILSQLYSIWTFWMFREDETQTSSVLSSAWKFYMIFLIVSLFNFKICWYLVCSWLCLLI